MKKNDDPFKLVVSAEKMSKEFGLLATHKYFEAAKEEVRNTFNEMDDIDGNQIEQFQSSGFYPRLWEMILYRAFKALSLTIVRSSNSPDFILDKGGMQVAVEAVTTNPTIGDLETEVQLSTALAKPEEKEIADHLMNQMIFKIGSSLFSKLQKKYWLKSNISGKPLVFAIQAFHHREANNFPDAMAFTYLYGLKVNHENDNRLEKIESFTDGEKTIEPFFDSENSEEVSGVLYLCSGNLHKFNRIGVEAGFGSPDVKIVRAGLKAGGESEEEFEYVVGDGMHKETWFEGFTLFHNPKAKMPIDKDFFRGIRQVWVNGTDVNEEIPDFHPLYEQTHGIVANR